MNPHSLSQSEEVKKYNAMPKPDISRSYDQDGAKLHGFTIPLLG